MTTTVNATLPQDDTYVKMVEYATNLKLTDKQIQQKIEQLTREGKEIPDTLRVLQKGDIVLINGIEYVAREVTSENNGFQSIVFQPQNSINGSSVLAIGGSYGITQFSHNPFEWIRDWVANNLMIGLKKLPPQFTTALSTLDTYKSQYNINSVAGYSLGAILAGLIAKFNRHSDVNA